MSSEPANILELLLLFKVYGLGDAKIMIVPLFETTHKSVSLGFLCS